MRLIDADALKTTLDECICSDHDRFSTSYAKSFIYDVPDVCGCLRFCGSVPSVADLPANSEDVEIGDVFHVAETGSCYINQGEGYVEIDDIESEYSELPSVTNCPNCGAPVSSHHCEYCGSYIR